MPEAVPPRRAFPAVQSLLSPVALAEMLDEAYGLREVRCHLIKATIRDVYRVGSREGPYVLIVYRHARRTIVEIEAELDVLDRLALGRVPVAPAVRMLSGERILALPAPEGTRYAVLFRYAAGMPLDRSPDRGTARRCGRLAAQVHGAADAWMPANGTLSARSPIDVTMLVDRPLALVEPLLTHRPADVTRLHHAADRLRRRLAALSTEPPAYGLVHGDFIAPNILSDDGEQLTLLDFDFCGLGWRAYDTASYVDDVDAGKSSSTVARSFVEGYQEIRVPAAWELEAVPLFLAARALFRLGNWGPRVEEWGRAALTDMVIDRHVTALTHHLAQVG